jgi:pseudouridine-5'-phosphate glycosidase
MKNLKLALSAVGIFAVVGTALAFTAKPYGTGTVYCNSICTAAVDFKVVASGGVANACPGAGQEYILRSATECITSAGPFLAVTPGK